VTRLSHDRDGDVPGRRQEQLTGDTGHEAGAGTRRALKAPLPPGF